MLYCFKITKRDGRAVYVTARSFNAALSRFDSAVHIVRYANTGMLYNQQS